ncbi:MAG: mechanosensitive ion channel [Deltaproteobacteria bacterium]|nr:mechanosensitive ion channel [Deltaproteobacteria bacterium]
MLIPSLLLAGALAQEPATAPAEAAIPAQTEVVPTAAPAGAAPSAAPAGAAPSAFPAASAAPADESPAPPPPDPREESVPTRAQEVLPPGDPIDAGVPADAPAEAISLREHRTEVPPPLAPAVPPALPSPPAAGVEPDPSPVAAPELALSTVEAAPAQPLRPQVVRVPVAPSHEAPTLRSYLPGIPWRGARAGFAFVALMLALIGGDQLLGRLSHRLTPYGLLPALHGTSRAALRLVAMGAGLAAISAFLPRSLAPALPFLIVTVAVALGWSARDLLPDLVAGFILLVERRVRPRRWLQIRGHAGIVEHIGLRATWLRDASGRTIAIPNRDLLSQPLEADPLRWPAVEVLVHSPVQSRRLIQETALSLPWVASEGTVYVISGEQPEEWRVRIRLIEAAYTERFRGALQELLDEQAARVAVREER